MVQEGQTRNYSRRDQTKSSSGGRYDDGERNDENIEEGKEHEVRVSLMTIFTGEHPIESCINQYDGWIGKQHCQAVILYCYQNPEWRKSLYESGWLSPYLVNCMFVLA